MKNNIGIFDSYYSINDRTFRVEPTVTDFVNLYSEYRITKSKAEEAKSDIYTFDEEGIWIYVQNNNIVQMSLMLTSPYLDFHPSEKFNGVKAYLAKQSQALMNSYLLKERKFI